MPHGDLSDLVGLSCTFFGLTSIFYPQAWFTAVGPLQPMLEGGAASPAAAAAIRIAGSGYLFAGLAAYVVRWNKVNAAAAIVGCAAAGATSAYVALSMDSWQFVPRPWYILSAVFALGVFHFATNVNKVLTWQEVKEKEEKAAAAKAAKGK